MMEVKRLILILTLFCFAISPAFAQKVGLNPGDHAPEINLNNPEGKAIPLSSLKGNMVFIDFWASWCIPCRKEHPNLKRVYTRFRNGEFDGGQSFTIYSVSLDKVKADWMQAIQNDKLEWPNQVSDLQGWKSAAARTYGINAIPYNLLIDGNGIIVAKELSAAELEEILASRIK
ncbi:MAG: TlpA disulfide reductase family protein [Bacteroidia bacterium]